MLDLLIDGPLLACPPLTAENNPEFNEKFVNFVARLADVSQLRRSLPEVRFWRESTLAAVLFNVGAYPFKHALAEAFKVLDPELGFQLEDVSTLANALILKSNCLNDYSQIEDLVVSECSIEDDPADERCGEMIDYLCRTVEIALPQLGRDDDFPDSVLLLSTAGNKSTSAIISNYSLAMVSYRDGRLETPALSRRLKLINYGGLLNTLQAIDPIEIWARGGNASLFDACCLLLSHENTEIWESSSALLAQFSIGSQFSNSAKALGFIHDPVKAKRLMGACIDLIVGRNLDRSHWLRVGLGPNDAQKVSRSGAKAWRHDIDDEFHLHYWKSGRSIQVANVVVHNNFSIDD